MVQSVDNRVQAKAYADRGFYVFPLVFRGKTPATKNGFKDATRDHAEIDRLWRDSVAMGIGIATGASNLLVVDIDTKDGKVGQASWDALVEQHGWDDETLKITTWSGGTHLYFWQPEERVRNSAGKYLGKDIDVRGDGGYVVAPPSVVREGDKFGTYEVDEDWPIADCPDWMAEALRKPAPVARPAGAPIAASTETEARVQALAAELVATPKGRRNDEASRLAYMAGQYAGAGQIELDIVIRIFVEAITAWGMFHTTQAESAFHDTIIRQATTGASKPRPWEASVATEEVVEPEEDAMRDLSDWGTNLGQAQHVRKFLGTRLIYADGVGWFAWDGKVWNSISEGFVLNLMGEFYRKQFRSMLEKAKSDDTDKYLNLAKAYKKFMSVAAQRAILTAMQTANGIICAANDLDADKELLNTPNGIVNLRTGEVTAHDPQRFMTRITSGRYLPNAPVHPDWTKSLSGLPETSADYLQLRLGQALTGYTPEDAVFYIGNGKNSKSLLLTDGPVKAAGGYAAMSGPALISTGQDSSAATPDKAGLRGVRLAYIEEMPEAGTLSVAELKRVVETSTIKARYLNSNPFEFDATHSLFVTSNYTPIVNQTDDGTWRRLCQVKFPIKFVAKPEGPNEREADGGLKRRVREGKDGQHDTIVTWMIQGAIRYFGNEALIGEEQRPLEVQEATMSWRMAADRIMAYYSERLVVDNDAMGVARNDLYADFSAFLAEQGHAKWSLETFASRFKGHERTVKAGVEVFRPSGNKRAALSRPEVSLPTGATWSSSGKLPELPQQPWAYTNLRFRTDADMV